MFPTLPLNHAYTFCCAAYYCDTTVLLFRSAPSTAGCQMYHLDLTTSGNLYRWLAMCVGKSLWTSVINYIESDSMYFYMIVVGKTKYLPYIWCYNNIYRMYITETLLKCWRTFIYLLQQFYQSLLVFVAHLYMSCVACVICLLP